jgi:GTP-binding protein
VINVCKTKHLTNHRKAFADISVGLAPPHILSLDDAIEYLGRDELLEVTPASLRIRKMNLNHEMRGKSLKAAKKARALL